MITSHLFTREFFVALFLLWVCCFRSLLAFLLRRKKSEKNEKHHENDQQKEGEVVVCFLSSYLPAFQTHRAVEGFEFLPFSASFIFMRCDGGFYGIPYFINLQFCRCCKNVVASLFAVFHCFWRHFV